MRAITLWQPWSTLIARGLKKYETRSWDTSYRGKLLIHAADRKVDRQGLINFHQGMGNDSDSVIHLVDLFIDFMELPRGCVVATANLVDSHRITTDWAAQQTKLELAVGDWTPGRYAWKLEKIRELHKPLICKGRQGLWIPNTEITEAINQTKAKAPSFGEESAQTCISCYPKTTAYVTLDDCLPYINEWLRILNEYRPGVLFLHP